MPVIAWWVVEFEAFCDLAADKVGIEALVTLGAHQERQQIR
nr:hypothetical protein [Rhodococcus qingshengii]